MGYAAEPHPMESGGCDWMVVFAISAKKWVGEIQLENVLVMWCYFLLM
jgi:hypothetical protein